MRVKLDENMPLRLAHILAALGHDTDTVPDENLKGEDDRTIWRATQAANRFFITQDLDFSDLSAFKAGTHSGLLLVRLRVPGRIALTDRVRDIFEREDVSGWARCFVVVTDRKIRIRKPRA